MVFFEPERAEAGPHRLRLPAQGLPQFTSGRGQVVLPKIGIFLWSPLPKPPQSQFSRPRPHPTYADAHRSGKLVRRLLAREILAKQAIHPRRPACPAQDGRRWVPHGFLFTPTLIVRADCSSGAIRVETNKFCDNGGVK